MNTHRHRVATFACLGLAALLSRPVLASSFVVPGAPAAALTAAAEKSVPRVQAGRISSVDVRRGVLGVDGRSYRINARETSFSDDRAEPAKTGIESLRIGNKVVVRSVSASNLPLAVQIVVQD